MGLVAPNLHYSTMQGMDLDAVDRAAEVISKAHSVVVFSGSGMSQESGVPTFREGQVGLWSRYNPEDLATPMAFAREPDLVWSWYMHRVHRLAEVNSNPGHIAVATMEEFIPHVVVITQNVDGLHERAGSTDILELHGRLGRYKCFAACQGDSTFVDLALIPHDDDHAPQCPNCGAAVRPDVVWYSEALPSGALHRAIAEASQCDVMLVIGTSGLVQPAASLPEIARQSKAFVIEINPVSGLLTSRVNLFLQGKSGALLPELVERIQTLVGGTS